jgi:adenylate cyclase
MDPVDEIARLTKENRALVRKAEQLSRKLEQLDKVARENEAVSSNLYKELDLVSQRLATEKEKVTSLLLNILPADISKELQDTGGVEPKKFEDATVLFTEFRGFTAFSEQGRAIEVVDFLKRYFDDFDDIVARHGVEKLKTIGDAYMCAGGVPAPKATHALDCVRVGLEMVETVMRLKASAVGAASALDIRIGVHSGPLVGGVIGKRKFVFDVWGDTVNTAARIESNGVLNAVTISQATYERVKDHVTCEFLRDASLKGKHHAMPIYVVIGVTTRAPTS